MATAVQLSQGNEFTRSSEGGGSVDSATRVYKVLLDSPGEAWDVPATIGVDIGDPYSGNNPIPCVSWEARAEGESRMVRIVTVRYRATPGFSSSGQDPKSESPTLRPALWSMSTSLQEVAAWGGRVVTAGSVESWSPAKNPVGDIVDGISRLEPVVTISIDQYSSTDGSNYMGYVGYVNNAAFTFSSLSIGMHCCMLQGISSTPVVEQFSQGLFRGFKLTFSFGVRSHWTMTRDGAQAIGWDVAVPQCGHNIINSGLSNSNVDQDTLNLEHEFGKVKTPLQLAANSSGRKMRAAVLISSPDTGMVQRAASMPVPLNDDGTPRSRSATPPILINRLCLQPSSDFGTNFSNFGIRFFTLPGN
jgi:hypothetical protein